MIDFRGKTFLKIKFIKFFGFLGRELLFYVFLINKSQFISMEHQSFAFQILFFELFLAVKFISDNRVADGLEMDADLISATGVKINFRQRILFTGFYNIIFG